MTVDPNIENVAVLLLMLPDTGMSKILVLSYIIACNDEQLPRVQISYSEFVQKFLFSIPVNLGTTVVDREKS
jgi:hypothetical protein